MKRIISIIMAAVMAFALAACTQKAPNEAAAPAENTQAPAQTTEAPTPEPTLQPAPASYNEEDAAQLRAFLETADENGVKNGDKLFAEYDPDDPSTWADGDRSILWDESGRLTGIALIDPYYTDEAEIELCGELDLRSLPELTVVEIDNFIRLEDMNVYGCDKLEYLFIQHPVKGSAVIDNIMPAAEFSVAGLNVNCRLTDNGKGILLTESGEMSLDVASNGSGYVGFRGIGLRGADASLGGFRYEIFAIPADGMQLIGWFDEMSDLYSLSEYVDITNEQPPLGDGFVLSASFSAASAAFPFYDGEAPTASGVIAEIKPGVPASFDLDFDGKPDTVTFTKDAETEGEYRISVVMGSEPGKTCELATFEYVAKCALRVLDCDTSDERLDLLFNGYTEDDGELVAAWRVSDEGRPIAIPVRGYAEIVTENGEPDGPFDAKLGIPVSVRTEIFDTQYLKARMTITNEGFKLLTPFRYEAPAEHNHGWRELKLDMPARVLNDGVPGQSVTIKAGEKVAPYETDMWSYLDVQLEDGQIVRIEISVAGGYVFIDGLPQDDYVEIWYAD